jgi:hypothetical protein
VQVANVLELLRPGPSAVQRPHAGTRASRARPDPGAMHTARSPAPPRTCASRISSCRSRPSPRGWRPAT